LQLFYLSKTYYYTSNNRHEIINLKKLCQTGIERGAGEREILWSSRLGVGRMVAILIFKKFYYLRKEEAMTQKRAETPQKRK